ncbi:MAG: PAS domain S-box protein [Candidatus Rokubacteria bacterium]|nr:PAS domain S-box protein [Candidatus Rokubacteria bacterium]
MQTKQDLRTFLEAAPDAMVVVGADGRIVLLNTQAELMFGYLGNELLDEGVELLVPTRDHDDHVRHREKYFASPAVRPMGGGLELYGRRRDGSEFPVEISLSPLELEGETVAMAAIRDITERKQVEHALHHMKAIVESSDDAIIGNTLDGVITSWNRGAAKMYGYSAAEAIGQSIAMLGLADRPNQLPAILDTVRRGEHVKHHETVTVRRDGHPIDVSLTVSPIPDAAGKVVGAATMTVDITERKRAEVEHASLIREQAARQEAEAAAGRASLLADASRLLSSSHDYEATLGQLGSIVVPAFADWLVVYLPDRAPRRPGRGTERRRRAGRRVHRAPSRHRRAGVGGTSRRRLRNASPYTPPGPRRGGQRGCAGITPHGARSRRT